MKQTRLYFISPRDMRKNRADCVHIMKVCQQFAGQGYEVLLVTPRVFRTEYRVARRDIFQLYGIPESFRIVELPTVLTDETPNLLSRIQKFFVFGLYYLCEIVRGRLNAEATLYCKCYISTFPAIILRRLGLLRSWVFFEKAEFAPGNRVHRLTAENADRLICINRYIHDQVLAKYALPSGRLHRLTFATQYPEIAGHMASKPAPSRRSLGLPEGKRLVMYAGKMGPQNLEIRYILEAAKLVSEYEFVLVGVKEEFRPWFKEYFGHHHIGNVTLVGFQPLRPFYEYVSSADLLVSYYDTQDPVSSTQRSPAKAGVYLCFGKPVIMADLPSLREWWSDEQIFFVPSDQPALLAEQIRYVFAHPEDAKSRAAKCLEFAKRNTYASTYSEVGRFMEACRNHLGAGKHAVHASQKLGMDQDAR